MFFAVKSHDKKLDFPGLPIKTKNATVNATAPENAPLKLNKTQMKILPILQANKYATYDELASTIGVDRMTIMRNMGTLKKNGDIRRVGGDKNGYWEVVDIV